jgi:hypothetical protein
VSGVHLLWFFITNDHNDTQYERCIAYRVFRQILPTVLFLTVLPVFVVGCTEQPTPYRPPTMVIQATKTVSDTASPTSTSQFIETPMPISTATCIDNLLFLEDLSLPDGTVVKPGALLDKRWLVENTGSCNWDKQYRLKFMSGAEFGAPLEQALYPARSGSKATIRLIFTAPSEAGSYQSAWQAYNSQGQPFGDPVFIQVTVGSDTP